MQDGRKKQQIVTGQKRGVCFFVLSMLAFYFLTGCGKTEKQPEEERQQIEFTVLEAREIPEKLLEVIEENKEKEIRLSYTDGEELYLVRGYGKQKTGGYSIAVAECAEDEETLWLDTRLLGPENQEALSEEPSYPYLVLKIKLREKEVMIT